MNEPTCGDFKAAIRALIDNPSVETGEPALQLALQAGEDNQQWVFDGLMLACHERIDVTRSLARCPSFVAFSHTYHPLIVRKGD
jgi:hypothetical protein